MTLRTGSLRIDPVAVGLDGPRVVALQKPIHGREIPQPFIALASPAVAEDHDGGRAPPLEIAGELGAEGLDARVVLVVEEVEVVEKARRLSNMKSQERVNTTLGHIHDLHGRAAGHEAGEIASQSGNARFLQGYPAGVGGLDALDAEETYRDDEHGQGQGAGESGHQPRTP